MCEYEKPSVTVDAVLFRGPSLDEVLLIERRNEPFAGKWALPGGFVNVGEDLGDAAMREIKEETGIECNWLRQVKAYGRAGRDPRGWVITIAFFGIVTHYESHIKAGDDATKVKWYSTDSLPELAFDHKQILFDTLRMLGR